MTNKNLYEEIQKNGINTYGCEYATYAAQLPREVLRNFAICADDMAVKYNRDYVQCVYDVMAQAANMGITKDIDISAFAFPAVGE